MLRIDGDLLYTPLFFQNIGHLEVEFGLLTFAVCNAGQDRVKSGLVERLALVHDFLQLLVAIVCMTIRIA